jgi:hypothetical protein
VYSQKLEGRPRARQRGGAGEESGRKCSSDYSVFSVKQEARSSTRGGYGGAAGD